MELLRALACTTSSTTRRRSPGAACSAIIEQMCSSLGEAHAQGIVHRDIKPENIYLEDRPGNTDFVKVLDFGIAKIIRGDIGGNSAPQLTATGQTLGTLEYMSPEQLMGKQLDGRSDVYALGVLAYEMITGQLPFPDAKGPAELITAQLKKMPPPASAANPSGDIPAGCDAILLRMLEKDRAKRYQDVDEVAADIGAVIQSDGRITGPSPVMSSGVTPPPVMMGAGTSPGAVGPPSLAGSIAPPSPAPAPRPYALAPPTEQNTIAGMNRTVVWLLIAVVVLLGALVGVYFAFLR